MRKLMVVEDSAAMRSLIASVVSQISDSDVIEIADGFEALRMLPRESVDLVVLDINMPDINGLELLSFLRKNPKYERTPVVIVTTEAGEEDRKRGMALGANAYLTKPFQPEELLSVVKKLLELP